MSAKGIKKRVRRGRPGYLLSLLSIVLLIYILGITALIIQHSQALTVYLKERVGILVEIVPETSTEKIITLQENLRKMPFIKPGSIEFFTKEDALASLVDDFGDELSNLDMTNPLFDVLSFNVWASFMESDSLRKLGEVIREQPIVSDVYYQEGLVVELTRNMEKVLWAGAFISVLFFLFAFILIHNTVRLALFSNRFLIKNMELVGASWGFITRPYVLKGLGLGMVGGIVAVGALYGTVTISYQNIPEMDGLVDWNSLFLLFLGLVVAGVVITTLSTYIAVNKFLRMSLEDLY